MCKEVVMAEKRKLEFDSLSGVSEAESADIHGVVASVSPMKKGKRASYFDCKLTDGEVQMRVVGFNCKLTDGEVQMRVVGFDCKLTDGEVQMRVVGFDCKLTDGEVQMRVMGFRDG